MLNISTLKVSSYLKNNKQLRYRIGLTTAIFFFSFANTQAQELSNLFFMPVPLDQADLITLNSGGLSDTDKQSAVDAIPRIQAEINILEQESPGDPELITQLNTLGIAQQALDQHEEAIASFNKATDIAIAIYGDNSLQQVPMLEQSIISHLKLNNISEITSIEEFLYSLKADQYAADSTEMYTAMTNLADWYSSAYMKLGYLSREPGFIPRVTSTNRARRQIGGAGSGDINNGSVLNTAQQDIFNGNIRDVIINDIIDIHLRKLENLYEEYQGSYSANTTLSMVVEVARRIARVSYHAEQEMDYEREVNIFDPDYNDSREEAIRNSNERRDESYDVGKAALEYVLNLVQSAEGVGAQQVTLALLDLADWELAYGRNDAAREAYQAAYQVLRDEGYNNASIDAALMPIVPIAIPRIASFPATQQTSGSLGLVQNPNYTGYIDASFALDELGNTTDITVLGSSHDGISNIQGILENQIKLTKYRPLLLAGELIFQDRLEYRYYYSY